MVHQAISDVRKVVPTGVISTGFLLALLNADSASAFGGEMPKTNIHNTPIHNDSGFFDIWKDIGHGIMVAFDWIIHIHDKLNDMTVNLFSWTYEFLLNNILCTPMFIFNNSAVFSEIAILSGASMFIVTLLSMIEGIKKICQRKKGISKPQDIKKIWKRYLVSLSVSGSAPLLFGLGFKIINKLIALLSSVGANKMTDFSLFSSMHIPGIGILDTILMLLFDIVIIGLLIPISLQAGRRFWNLMCLTSITPLALIGFVFDDNKHYLNIWWENIKKLAQSQLIVAFFITLMGLFIFGVGTISGNLFPKIIMIIGALYSLINPPTFIKSKMDHGDTIEDVGEDMWRKGKGLLDTLTLRNVHTFGILKKRNANKHKRLMSLRKSTGKRFNK